MKKNDHPQNPKFSQSFLVRSVQSFAEFLSSFQFEFEDKSDKCNSCQVHNKSDWINMTKTTKVNWNWQPKEDGQITNLFRMRNEQKHSTIRFFPILIFSWHFFWFEQTKNSLNHVSGKNVMWVKKFLNPKFNVRITVPNKRKQTIISEIDLQILKLPNF